MDMDAFMQSLSFAADDPEAPTQVFIQSTIDSDPVGGKMLPASSSVEGGFGPGPYTGGYTGVDPVGGGAHGIYWGSFDDPGALGATTTYQPGFGPGYLTTLDGDPSLVALGAAQQEIGTVITDSSTGNTVLMPASSSDSVIVPDAAVGPEIELQNLGGTEPEIQLGGGSAGGTDINEMFSNFRGGHGGTSSAGGPPVGGELEGGGVRAQFRGGNVPTEDTGTNVTGRTGTTVDSATVQSGETGEAAGGPGPTEEAPWGYTRDGSIIPAPPGYDPGVPGDGRFGPGPKPVWGEDPGIDPEVLPELPGGKTLPDVPTHKAGTGYDPDEHLMGGGDGGEDMPGFFEEDVYVPIGKVPDGVPLYVAEIDEPTPGGGDVEMQVINSGETPVPTLESGGAPMLLEDMPPAGGSEFSWDMINMNDMPADIMPALQEFVADPMNQVLGSAGVGTGMGRVLGFLKQRGIDAFTGILLTPLFNWLNDATGDPWASRLIQGTLAFAGLAIGGDPFGVIAAPIVWGIQEYMRQRARLNANADPESEMGKKFGYVREGDTWYPAIQTSKERDEGWVGSNKTKVRFQYGKDLKWRKEKGSTAWVPYFEDGTYNMKDFHVWDSEVDDPKNEGGIMYQRRVDPLRDFYYLTEEDTVKMLQGFAGGEVAKTKVFGYDFTEEEQASIKAAQTEAFTSFQPHADTSWSDSWKTYATASGETEYYGNYGAYVDQLQDIRKSLELMQDYRYSDEGQIHTTDMGKNEFEGSRDFRTNVNLNPLALPHWKNTETVGRGLHRDYRTLYHHQGDRMVGVSGTDLSAAGIKAFKNQNELRWLTDEFVKAHNQLQDTRKVAGTSMGFLDKFKQTDEWSSPVDVKWGARGTLQEKEGIQSIMRNGWALYQDGTWALGKLDTAAQLKAMLARIEDSGDIWKYQGTPHYRNSDQRAYLAQKTYTRYLYSKINQLGGINYLFSLDRYGDKSRVQYDYVQSGDYGAGPGSALHYALDPMYSGIDDDGRDARSYGTDLVRGPRDDPTEQDDPSFADVLSPFGREFIEQRNIDVLKRAGVLRDGFDDPDYIAGRFDNLDDFGDFSDYTGSVPGEDPYDTAKHDFVKWGEGSPGSRYNPETNTYEMPVDWVDPLAKKDPEVPAKKDPEPLPEIYDPFSEFGTAWGGDDDWNPDAWLEPSEVPEGMYQDPDTGAINMIPEGWTVDDNGNLIKIVEVQDTPPEDTPPPDQETIDADEDDKLKKPQHVPDATSGAGAVHENPEHHEHFAFAPSDVPAHIPLETIAASVQQSVKVI